MLDSHSVTDCITDTKYTKNTGYPVSDSWWYTINNKGHIRTHYEYLLIVGIILYCLYKMFFCV